MTTRAPREKDNIVLQLAPVTTLPSRLRRHTFHLQVESILPLDTSVTSSFKSPEPKTALSDTNSSFESSRFVLTPNYMVAELVEKAQNVYCDYGPASMFSYGKEETQNIILGIEGGLINSEELDSAMLILKIKNGGNQCNLIVVSDGEQQTIGFNTQVVDILFIGKSQYIQSKH